MTAKTVRTVILVAAVLSVRPAYGWYSSVHVDWSPKSRMVQNEDQSRKEPVNYRGFAWEIGFVKESTTMGIRYARRSLIDRRGRGRNIHGPLANTLYTLSMGAQWEKSLVPTSRVLVFFWPVLENASETRITLNDVKFSGGMLFRKIMGFGGEIGVGAIWSRAWGCGLPLPLVEIRADKLHSFYSVYAMLPLQISVSMSLHPRLRIGLSSIKQGGEYRAEGDEDFNEEEWVQYSSYSAGPNITIELPGSIRLVGRGGLEFGGQFDGVEANGRKVKRYLESMWMLQGSIYFGSMPAFNFSAVQGWR